MAAFPNTKPHYEILDGLRGVAAIMVVFPVTIQIDLDQSF